MPSAARTRTLTRALPLEVPLVLDDGVDLGLGQDLAEVRHAARSRCRGRRSPCWPRRRPRPSRTASGSPASSGRRPGDPGTARAPRRRAATVRTHRPRPGPARARSASTGRCTTSPWCGSARSSRRTAARPGSRSRSGSGSASDRSMRLRRALDLDRVRELGPSGSSALARLSCAVARLSCGGLHRGLRLRLQVLDVLASPAPSPAAGESWMLLRYATMSLIACSFFGPPPSMPHAGIGVPGRP